MKRRNINLKEMAHTLGRVLRYMLKNYKGSFCVVVVCTLVSALCTLSGTLFLQSLIDDYILPLTQSAAPDFGPLGWALAQMACVYALGILSSYGYNRIMVNISQGTMRNLRDDLFTHMESLPIQYFDTHAHGDIMSVYRRCCASCGSVTAAPSPGKPWENTGIFEKMLAFFPLPWYHNIRLIRHEGGVTDAQH